jgi:hypothetical protein
MRMDLWKWMLYVQGQGRNFGPSLFPSKVVRVICFLLFAVLRVDCGLFLMVGVCCE